VSVLGVSWRGTRQRQACSDVRGDVAQQGWFETVSERRSYGRAPAQADHEDSSRRALIATTDENDGSVGHQRAVCGGHSQQITGAGHAGSRWPRSLTALPVMTAGCRSASQGDFALPRRRTRQPPAIHRNSCCFTKTQTSASHFLKEPTSPRRSRAFKAKQKWSPEVFHGRSVPSQRRQLSRPTAKVNLGVRSVQPHQHACLPSSGLRDPTDTSSVEATRVGTVALQHPRSRVSQICPIPGSDPFSQSRRRRNDEPALPNMTSNPSASLRQPCARDRSRTFLTVRLRRARDGC